MPSIRRGAAPPPKRVLRNGAEIKKVMRGQQEIWSSFPSAFHWAKFDTSNLLANSGTVGGMFAQSGGSIAARAPQGVWIPESVNLAASGPSYGEGFTMMGWIKSSKALAGVVPIRMLNAVDFAHIQIEQSSNTPSDIRASISLAGGGTNLRANRYAQTGAWLHVCLVMGPPNASLMQLAELYVNGELVDSASAFGQVGQSDYSFNVGNNWEGDAGQMKLYAAPMGADQVSKVYEEEGTTYGHPAAPVPVRPYSYSSSTERELPQGSWTLLHQTSVEGDGQATISGDWYWRSVVFNSSSHLRAIRFLVNGTQVGYWTHGGTIVNASSWTSNGSTGTLSLKHGDTVRMEAFGNNGNTVLRSVNTHALSINPA